MKKQSEFCQEITINYCLPAYKAAAGWHLEKEDKILSPREAIDPEKEVSYLRLMVMAEASDLVWPIPEDKYGRKSQKIEVIFLDGNITCTSINGSRVDVLNYYLQQPNIKNVIFDIH